MLPFTKCHQGPEAATAALSLPGDTLLDEAAAELGIHQPAFGTGRRFPQARILNLLASGEPGKLPGFEDPQVTLHTVIYPTSWDSSRAGWLGLDGSAICKASTGQPAFQ